MIRFAGPQTSAGARSRTFRAFCAIAIAVAVAACSSTAASNAPSQAVVVPTPAAITPAPATPEPTPTPPPTASPSLAASVLAATAVPTSIDPCQLVPAQEASQLAGATYTTGKEESTSGNSKICWYGANTLNVFEVLVAQAPDQATIDAEKADALAQLQKTAGSPIQITMLTGVGDDAASLSLSESISGQTLNGSGIYVLKGLVFFAIVDLVANKPAPSGAAMQAEALTVIGRLP